MINNNLSDYLVKSKYSTVLQTALYPGYGMEWSGNFGVEYGRCQNGMEDFKNGMEDNFPYFHTNSILDFAHGIYRKMYTDMDN